MKAIFISLASLALIAYSFGNKFNTKATNTYEDQFNSFKILFKKSYGSATENDYRFTVFTDNMKFVEETNEKENDFQLGVNQYSDLSFTEFKNKYTMGNLNQAHHQLEKYEIKENSNLKSSQDWSTTKHVSHVKNQAACGSCWAFSATGALEALMSIEGNGQHVLSEQELVDCSRSYGNMGCNGGLLTSAFDYIRDYGLTNESSYRYTARDGGCRQGTARVAKEGTYTSRQAFSRRNRFSDVMNLLSERPVAVVIEVRREFQSYRGGILKADVGCGYGVNHGVLLVGYNQSGSYTKIKNSWGSSWGEQGYLRISFEDGRTDSCGITHEWSAVVTRN